jgi:hypothetical protein
MRFGAAALSALLLVGGTCYFFARAKAHPSASLDSPRSSLAALLGDADQVADEYDREAVRALLETPNRTERQSNALVEAAGRRYMRRKLAFSIAKQAVDAGNGEAGGLDYWRGEIERARKICDVAERSGDRTLQMAAIAQADWELERLLIYGPSTMSGLAERYDGGNSFTEADLEEMNQEFFKIFGQPLPVSARGDGAVHRAMGFDHTGRFDLALSPSQPEGVWARHYLTGKHVTYFAFRSAVPGKATGAHIHIGPASKRRVPKS